MENKNFSDYEIAKITVEEESKLKELERAICEESKKDVVLIAYQQKVTDSLI